jgi:hypothetical protein
VIYDAFVAETTPIPVRIPRSLLPRLDKAAARLGTNRARLIAFCATTFLNEFERRGTAIMPPDWSDLMLSLDNRTRESRELALVEDRPHAVIQTYPASTTKPDVMEEKYEQRGKALVRKDKQVADALRKSTAAAVKIAKGGK